MGVMISDVKQGGDWTGRVIEEIWEQIGDRRNF